MNAKLRLVAVLAGLVLLVVLTGWVLIVLPGIDVFVVSVAVAISWCLWLDRRPPEDPS